MKFEVENLSCGQADCFLINIENYLGDTCTILVDGNRQGKANLLNTIVPRISNMEKLDYIVVTHVDNDHLGGILSLFQFNADTSSIQRQLKDTIIIYNFVSQGEISYRQARSLEELLHGRRVINSFSIDYDNRNSMLKLLHPTRRNILKSTKEREKNAYLTFLGPDKAGANAVARDYQRCKLTGASSNEEIINKNSITFLLEFAGKRMLFLGDAYLTDTVEVISNIEGTGAPLKITLIKVAHHGAKDNNALIGEFAQKHQCRKFIITGSVDWNKKHPAKEVLEQLYPLKPEIYTDVNLLTIDTKYYNMQKTEKIINIL